VFLRGGFVIPLRERIRRTSDLVPDDPYVLLIVLDKQVCLAGDFTEEAGVAEWLGLLY